jgi:hypothetical protein
MTAALKTEPDATFGFNFLRDVRVSSFVRLGFEVQHGIIQKCHSKQNLTGATDARID